MWCKCITSICAGQYIALHSTTLFQPFPLQEQNQQNIYRSSNLWSADLASAEGGCLISTSCFVLEKHNLSRNHPKEPLRNFNSGKENRVKPLDKQSEPQFFIQSVPFIIVIITFAWAHTHTDATKHLTHNACLCHLHISPKYSFSKFRCAYEATKWSCGECVCKTQITTLSPCDHSQKENNVVFCRTGI